MLLRSALLSFMLALVPATAAAQISDADKSTARALAQQGQDALVAKDFATAADRFSRAVELVHAPTLALGLARAHVGLGRWISAQETYNRILREGVPSGAPPAFAKAIADARQELDALEPRIPGVIISLAGATSATVTIDGVPVSSAVLGVNRPLDPGKHTIRATKEGFVTAEVSVTAMERKAERVTLTLDRAPPPPLAGAEPSPRPAPTPPLQPAVNAAPVPIAPPPAPPAPAPTGSLRKTLGFVGIGVGGAGLVVGAVAGGLAVSKHGVLVRECPHAICNGHQSDLDSYHLVSNLSTAGLVAGGALAAAGIVLVVTGPVARTSVGELTPVLGVGVVGVQGKF
jgi:hypothetical protein